jgi:hypothetical protein
MIDSLMDQDCGGEWKARKIDGQGGRISFE